MKFYFDVRGDKIVAREGYKFVEGNENTYEAVFTFDDAWHPDMARQCICEVNGKRYVTPIISGSCLLPEMVKGSSYIGVIGVITDYELVARISTDMITFGVSRGAYNGEVGEEFKSAAEVWEIYLSDMEKSRQEAEAAADRAEKEADRIKNLDASAEEGIEAAVTKTETEDGISLKFTLPKGEKGDEGPKGDTGDRGPKGEKGADGDTPVKGVDYFTPEDIEELDIPNDEVKSLQYYGDANIVPSDASLFKFNVNYNTQEAEVSANSTDISGDIVIPYEYEEDGVKFLVTAISSSAFQNCENITSVIISKSVKQIGNRCFMNATKLTSIKIPDSVKTLGNACFVNSAIKKLIIPDGITQIDVQTLSNLFSLESIVLPSSLQKIAIGNFVGAENLKDIYFTGTKKEWNKINIDSTIPEQIQNATIHYEWTDVTKEYVDEKIGDIDTALDAIISIQNTLIGGESV